MPVSRSSVEPAAAPRRRPRNRKQLILQAAGELFRQHGYAQVGMDDIGAAVGISGPAIYTHYRGKGDLLLALMEQALATVEDGIARADAEPGTDVERLRTFIEVLAKVSVHQAYLAGLYVREHHNLPVEAIGALDRRRRTIFRDEMRLLAAVRPDLDDGELRARLLAVASGLLSAPVFVPMGLGADDLEALLTRMAMAALLVE